MDLHGVTHVTFSTVPFRNDILAHIVHFHRLYIALMTITL